jgi:HupE/UreJ protein
MKGNPRLISLIVGALATLAAGAAGAHEITPCLLELRAIGAGRYEIVWKPSSRAAGIAELAPSFPPRCQRIDSPVVVEDSAAAHFILDCGPQGLAGAEIRISGLDVAGTDAVVRYAGEGREVTAALRPDAPAMTIPLDPGGSRLALGRTYVALGLTHILRGPDHLLFLLGLLLLVRRTAAPSRRARAIEIARTITAFTVAHSITLALAVCGVVRIPPAPVEATIALSVLLLAVELARPGAAPSRRSPWIVAFACGLLHGFGFAGALAQVGLPAGQIPAALLLFNVGVEAGQLAFVLAVVAALGAAQSVLRRAPVWTNRVPAYVIGSLAAYWCIERVLAFWS